MKNKILILAILYSLLQRSGTGDETAGFWQDRQYEFACL